jgi:hypothetical protein
MFNYFHSTKAYALNPELMKLFVSTFHTTYNVLSKIKNNITSDFFESKSNSKIPFSFLLKIIIKFEFILSLYFLFVEIYLFILNRQVIRFQREKKHRNFKVFM